jgi:hypothetical protein
MPMPMLSLSLGLGKYVSNERLKVVPTPEGVSPQGSSHVACCECELPPDLHHVQVCTHESTSVNVYRLEEQRRPATNASLNITSKKATTNP